METKTTPTPTAAAAAFPDYFKSELMETLLIVGQPAIAGGFPDYFKSELMETKSCSGITNSRNLSRLLQIGINGNPD